MGVGADASLVRREQEPTRRCGTQALRASARVTRAPALAVIAREMTLRRGGAVQIWLASERPVPRRGGEGRGAPGRGWGDEGGHAGVCGVPQGGTAMARRCWSTRVGTVLGLLAALLGGFAL